MGNIILTSQTEEEQQEALKKALSVFFAENNIVLQAAPVEQDRKFSIQELADYLGASVLTIQNYRNQGVIPYHQLGRTVWFYKSEIDECSSSEIKKCIAKIKSKQQIKSL